ncbi:unnamed protein product [Phytophthora fragariaefolia]|uniref:Unnamed protein product n=1 Tax=Phytophthora fragariaefolia TaxID=1490495 RepID=A0A9W6XCE8_9STRA|nr:unnamed protein product [Phytophthora fragariaefolia]
MLARFYDSTSKSLLGGSTRISGAFARSPVLQLGVKVHPSKSPAPDVMALTRAQARAEAEAQATQVNDVEGMLESADTEYPDATGEYDTEGATRASALVVADKSGQEGQSNAQSAALMAVQPSTETGIMQLTNQQLAIAGRFQEELMATQSTIQEQFMTMQVMQAQAGEEIERSVTEKFLNALREVQCESQALVTAQSNGVNRLETQLDAKIDDAFQTLTSRIQRLVDEQMAARQHASNDSEKTVELVLELVEKSTAGIHAHVKQSVDRGFQVVRDELQQALCASTVASTSEPALDALKHLVVTDATRAERRIEAQMQRALTAFQSDMHLQVHNFYSAGPVSAASERERQAILQVKEAELRQLQAAANAREAELQTKEAELNRCMAEVVVERQRDPASTDISAEIKRSVERSVQTIIDLIRGAVDRYVQAREEVKTEIENRGSISENDEDGDNNELSEEDRNAQQRMRDALVRAQATPIHSLVVQVEGPLFQDGERVRTKYNDHVSPPVVPVRALPTQRVRGASIVWRYSNMAATTFEYDHEGNKIGDVGGGKADDYCIELARA